MDSNNKIYNLQSLKNILKNKLRVGLFGGSFNPAHIGHLEISKYALSKLNLDYVIWLVAVQNPLKEKYKTSFSTRCIDAAKFTNHDRILVSDIEYEINSPNSFFTIDFFCRTFKDIEFTWMMGADCLESFYLWENYSKFTQLVDIAIFDRPGYSKFIESSNDTKELLKNSVHRILFCREKMIDISSTEIRETLK